MCGTAVDSVGGGRNSPLVTQLMQHLHRGEVQQAVQRVVKAVYESTNGQQRPWRQSDMMDDFYLGEPVVSIALLLDELRVYGEQRDVQSIVSFMKQHLPLALLQQKACEMLGNLTGDRATRQLIVAAGGLQSVGAAMQQHLPYMAVQRSACAALAAFAIDRSDHHHIVSAGCIKLIVAAMQQHSSDVVLQRLACKALADLSRSDFDSSARVVSAGGTLAVVAAMQQHSSDAVVQEGACESLCRTSSQFWSTKDPLARWIPRWPRQNDTLERSVATAALQSVLAAMRSDTSNAKVQMYALARLQLSLDELEQMAFTKEKFDLYIKAALSVAIAIFGSLVPSVLYDNINQRLVTVLDCLLSARRRHRRITHHDSISPEWSRTASGDDSTACHCSNSSCRRQSTCYIKRFLLSRYSIHSRACV